jgi:hypothetical protein
MISFTTWLRQIGRTCRFLADEKKLQDAWVHGDTSGTSIVDFDELYEQLFDDLDSDAFQEGLKQYLPYDSATESALNSFLDSVRKVDSAMSANPELKDTTTLLNSVEWRQVEGAAKKIIDLQSVRQAMDRE